MLQCSFFKSDLNLANTLQRETVLNCRSRICHTFEHGTTNNHTHTAKQIVFYRIPIRSVDRIDHSLLSFYLAALGHVFRAGLNETQRGRITMVSPNQVYAFVSFLDSQFSAKINLKRLRLAQWTATCINHSYKTIFKVVNTISLSTSSTKTSIKVM